MMQPQGAHFILHGLVNVTDVIVRYVSVASFFSLRSFSSSFNASLSLSLAQARTLLNSAKGHALLALNIRENINGSNRGRRIKTEPIVNILVALVIFMNATSFYFISTGESGLRENFIKANACLPISREKYA